MRELMPAAKATPSNSSTGTLRVKMVDPEIFTPGHGGTYAPRSLDRINTERHCHGNRVGSQRRIG